MNPMSLKALCRVNSFASEIIGGKGGGAGDSQSTQDTHVLC